MSRNFLGASPGSRRVRCSEPNFAKGVGAMIGTVLVLYGAVLFTNAFMLLGKVDGRAVAPLNLFIGILGVVIGLHTAIVNALGPYSSFVATLVIIFAVTYLLVAAMGWGALDGKAVGYYCVFGMIACFMWAGAQFAILKDWRFGTFCILWGVLFGMFAGNLAFGRNWAKATAYTTIFEVFATLLIPGYMLTLGIW